MDTTCPRCDSCNCDIPQDESGYVCAECGFTWDTQDDESEEHDDGMDGDHESALASAGFGTDEDYGGGCFNEPDMDDGMGPDYE